MLKIKDNVDLKELEKYGFKKGEDTQYVSYGHYGKVFEEQLDNYWEIEGSIVDLIFVISICKKRIISCEVTSKNASRSICSDNDEPVIPYIKDLIQADLVEKV